MADARGQNRGNSGVFLQGRHEVQILDSFGKAQVDARECGALFGEIAPMRNACNPPENWQAFDITFHAPRPGRQGHITVVLNDVTVIDNEAFEKVSTWGTGGNAGAPGPILLQSHGASVRFRNLWLLPLTATSSNGDKASDKFTPLFNGKDLAGWKTHPEQNHGWTVQDGWLMGRSEQGGTHLFSERGDYGNFHLRAEVMINDLGNSGIFFRSPFAPSMRYPGGYEAQIMSRDKIPDAFLTGSLFGLVRSKLPPPAAHEWFTLEIIAVENEMTVKVNGKDTAHYVDPKRTAMRGHFALEANDPRTTVVRFRKIEVKELPAGGR
jgi:hypothetical protein